MATLNLFEEHARERAGMPPKWKVYRWACMPPGRPKPLYFECVGAVAPPYKSGPRKGRENWKRRDPETERTVYITPAEQDAWEAAWSARTGLCLECTGKGEKVKSWSAKEGTTYKPCRTCGGTGRNANGQPTADATPEVVRCADSGDGDP